MCKCQYCGATSEKKEVKDIAYGLYAMYQDICVDCYFKMEIRAEKDNAVKITV